MDVNAVTFVFVFMTTKAVDFQRHTNKAMTRLASRRSGGWRRVAVGWLWLGLGLAGGTAAAQSDPLVNQWIASQTNLHTWSAEAIQTRALKTLSEPLVSTGRVWVAMPDRFRWELGQPAETIAVRQPDELILVYPRLKRIEKYPLNDKQPGLWQDALALLDASFPRSRADLDARFRVLAAGRTNGTVEIRLQPRSGRARKFMSEIAVGFYTNDFSPASTEPRFSDGSVMRNDFTHGVVNPPLAAGLFEVKPEADFTVVEPLKQ